MEETNVNIALKHCVSLLGISFLAVCLSLPEKAHAKDSITWYVSDWAPFYITRGKQKRKGINDKLIRYIHRQLPGYEMETKNMNATVMKKALENGDNICQLDLFVTPEREKLAYFTKTPAIIDAPLRLFIRAKDEKRLNLPPVIDINELLNNEKLKGTFVKNRSYNTLIDDAIKNTGNKNVKVNESTKRVIKDFFRGKTDYVVEYSAVISYMKSINKYRGEIYSLTIKDTQPYVMGYVGCSKTLWGKTTIDAIDEVLKKHRHDDAYKKILEEWHDDRSKQILIDNYSNF